MILISNKDVGPVTPCANFWSVPEFLVICDRLFFNESLPKISIINAFAAYNNWIITLFVQFNFDEINDLLM